MSRATVDNCHAEACKAKKKKKKKIPHRPRSVAWELIPFTAARQRIKNNRSVYIRVSFVI